VARRLVIRLVAGAVAAIIVIVVAVVMSQGGSSNSNANGPIISSSANSVESSPATRGASPSTDANDQGNEGSTDVESLNVGDCFDNPSGSDVSSVNVAPCTQPHDTQVYAEFNLTEATYPGDSTVQKEAESGCDSRESALNQDEVTDSMQESELVPEADGWDMGNNTVACLVINSSPTLTKSLLNG
jgi:hypothetical protein